MVKIHTLRTFQVGEPGPAEFDQVGFADTPVGDPLLQPL